MDGNSLDIKQENINKLKELMPEVFTEGDKIDFEKLKLTLGEDIDIANERYVLNWAGKSEAFKVLQTPTSATLAPDKDESVNFDTTENIFIEGENLEVLKILQKSYYGKIKMIYIDPPYNTGNDSFIYPDKFSETKEDYLKRIGEKDEEGFLLKEGLFRKNSKENGQYHSNWLNMMYPRLFLAKNLLRDDGVIFVSIDDYEVNNLRNLMNEIFGEENFINNRCFVWHIPDGTNKGLIARAHEYIIGYAKNIDNVKVFYRDIDNGNKTSEERCTNTPSKDNPTSEILFTKGMRYTGQDKIYEGVIGDKEPIEIIGKMIFENGRLKEDVVLKSSWRNKDQILEFIKNKVAFDEKNQKISEIYFAENGKPKYKKELEYFSPKSVQQFKFTKVENDILDNFGFSNPKPTSLITFLASLISQDNDIVLDFFAGSGTTAHAIFNLNKLNNKNIKYILIQLPELIEEDMKARNKGYETISEISKERIRQVINIINDERNSNPKLFADKKIDLGFKAFNLKYSNFKLWRGDIIENGEDLTEQISVFENPVKEGTEEENILYELILKSGYELTTKIEKKSEIYIISDGDLIVALNKIDENVIKSIIELKPKKCIALDKLFDGNDQLKTNTVLQMKDAGVEFKTI